MPILHIIHKRDPLTPRIPHLIYINGQLIGQLRNDEVNIEMPEGTFDVRIQSLIKWFSSTQRVQVNQGMSNELSFESREKVWDILFFVDILGSIAKFFFTLPHPWELIYQIFSWGYLILWIIYEIIIRKHYFKTEFYHKVMH